jgi:hypothetical protein
VSSHPPISPRIGAVVRSPRREVRGCRRCSGSLPAAVRAMGENESAERFMHRRNCSRRGGRSGGPISVPGAGAGRRPGEGGLMALTGRAGKSCLGPSCSFPGSDTPHRLPLQCLLRQLVVGRSTSQFWAWDPNPWPSASLAVEVSRILRVPRWKRAAHDSCSLSGPRYFPTGPGASSRDPLGCPSVSPRSFRACLATKKSPGSHTVSAFLRTRFTPMSNACTARWASLAGSRSLGVSLANTCTWRRPWARLRSSKSLASTSGATLEVLEQAREIRAKLVEPGV